MCSSSRLYVDILEPRREETSNYLWTVRQINPHYSYEQPHKPTPQWHKDEVLRSRKIQELIEQISAKQNVPREQLVQQIVNILNEIGYNRKLKLIRWIGLVLVKICLKVCHGIYVNRDSVEQLKGVMGTCPVVFVPSHRSYADFILMSLMCFNEELAIPTIAAGMDFQGMWAMGTMLRDSGAFFMRRSYNDDSLYWTTFKQYVSQITTKGDLPIEFFIEGTRSRSCKSLSPKYGLISMILKALFLCQVPDVIFVPINISYDRVMEEKLFAFELLGIPKPKESTSAFFKSLSIIKEKFGKIHFDFASPISAKAFFGDKLEIRSQHNLQPLHMQEITPSERRLIPSLAHEIVRAQQKHCVLTPFNLIAILLDNNLTNGHGLLGIAEMESEMLWLKEAMEHFGAFVNISDAKLDLTEAFDVHHDVIRMDDEGRVTLAWNKIVLDQFNPNRLKAHALLEKTITFSVPFMLLQIYINPTLHYLIDAAVLLNILKYYKQRLTQDELYGHYHFLRSLLSQDFVTFGTREKTEFDEALVNCMKLNLITRTSDGCYEPGGNKKLEQIICTLLDCFLHTYYVVCQVLIQSSTSICDEKSVLAKVQSEIEQAINDDNMFVHPYSLSLDTITNCLNSLTAQGVLKKSRNSNGVVYEINKEKVSLVGKQLELCIPNSQALNRKMESVQLHLRTKL